MMKKWMKKAVAFLCLLSLLAGSAAGCGKDFTVVLTTGLKKNEVFRIEKMSCTLPELMVYLTNLQNRYAGRRYGKRRRKEYLWSRRPGSRCWRSWRR